MINTDRPGWETESSEASDRRAPADPVDPVASLFLELAALRDYGAHFLQAKIDLAKWRVRTLVILAIAGFMGGACGVAIAVYAGICVLDGLAGGLTVLLGNRPWLGTLLAGILGLGSLALTAALLVKSSQARWKRQKAEEYDARRTLQRARHGHTVDEPASGNGAADAAAGSPLGS